MSLTDKFKDAKDKATDAVAEHGDKIEAGIDKVAGFVDDKTGGKFSDKIEGATSKAKDALGKVEGDKGEQA
ncbi:antitoxin [Nocardioides sp. WS12]|uniref:antitoxin n=1 Tax=Nocardioides sp. WS12 TaxID=2486272 RepID=UPI0015FC85F4|nr:antitoxin [Nocardioides sp. WS12]